MLAAQIMALIIFLAMFVLIIMDKFEKQYVTLICGLLTLIFVFGVAMQSLEAVSRTLNIRGIFTKGFWYATEESASSGINWATILFLAGMMVMVEGMARVGFFRWLCMTIAKAVKYKVVPIFITFMLMSFVLSMFIDSITVILFLAAVTVELSQLLKFNPVPMILSEVFCANLGGSATMCGDPPNIIIGTAFGYSFADFVKHTGLIAMISMVFVLVYFYLSFHKQLRSSGKDVDVASLPDPKNAILDRRGFGISAVIFGIAVILLVTHAMTGLTVATIGVIVAVLTVVTTFIEAGKDGLKEVMGHVDYKTLLFFIGLFVVVGGLEETGVLSVIATFIEEVSGGNAHIMIAIIIWVSALASAFIDNIPFAATMVPVISSLAATSGVHLDTLAWALSMGTDIGGSATPIGASANVVGMSVAAKSGHPVTWCEYCKHAVPATLIVLVISTLVIFARYL